jgi:hypothetical protein
VVSDHALHEADLGGGRPDRREVDRPFSRDRPTRLARRAWLDQRRRHAACPAGHQQQDRGTVERLMRFQDLRISGFKDLEQGFNALEKLQNPQILRS